MKRRKGNSAARRAKQAVDRALKAIEAAGWTVTATLGGRFVARKRRFEDDESVTLLFESDYTIEGLAALVNRREREENR